MGGQQQGGNAGMDQLKAQQDREKIADALGQSFQKIGANVAQPMALPQLGGGGAGQSAQSQALMQQQAGQVPSGMAATGPLFQGVGGGGIDEQQLAMILSRLGYGGGQVY